VRVLNNISVVTFTKAIRADEPPVLATASLFSLSRANFAFDPHMNAARGPFRLLVCPKNDFLEVNFVAEAR
jgi:hypothetical protein